MTNTRPLLALLILAACQAVPTPLAEPLAVTAQGSYRHEGTRLVFPERLGAFERVAITAYDADARDVGVGYNALLGGAPVVVTVYAYPAPQIISIGSPPQVVESARQHLCDKVFEGEKAQILRDHPDAVQTDEGGTGRSVSQPDEASRTARFEHTARFPGGIAPVTGSLRLGCYLDGAWLVKTRVTTPRGREAEGAVDDLLADLARYRGT